MISEREWNTINSILLDLYTIEDVSVLFQKVMKTFRMLISYSQGYFVLLDEEQKIRIEDAYFINMDEKLFGKYVQEYYDLDYLQYLYEFAEETIVYKDTDILDDNIRTETEFYKKFLKPANIPYGCGILLIKNNRIIAIMNLFRNEVLGDFSDKDIYILNILKKHLANMVSNTVRLEREQGVVEKCFLRVREDYKLTNREGEILELLCCGLSNSEIGDKLNVSLSTVKKHVYNLYEKIGINSRTQLINLVYGR